MSSVEPTFGASLQLHRGCLSWSNWAIITCPPNGTSRRVDNCEGGTMDAGRTVGCSISRNVGRLDPCPSTMCLP
jgi:hypothetical protein